MDNNFGKEDYSVLIETCQFIYISKLLIKIIADKYHKEDQEKFYKKFKDIKEKLEYQERELKDFLHNTINHSK